MSADENKALVRRFFEELCNQRRLDLAETLMTADHRYHDPQLPDAPPGPQGMAQTVAIYQNGVEGHWGIEEMVAADNDRVVTRWTGTGRHTGDVMGIPPTGKSIKVSAISIHRIADGKLAENWTVWDTLGFLQQIGAIPVPGQTGH